MLLAAMLAMVLAAAVPALAQSVTQVGQGNVACVQTAVQSQVGNTQIAASQYGDATNINVQNISQECNISVSEVNTAIKYLPVKKYASAPAKKYASAPAKKYASASASAYSAPAKYQYEYKKYYKSAPAAQYQYKYSASPSASAYSASYSASASAYSAPAAELPPTGGSSLIALGAGVLLVAGGLLARRIVR
jgi:hypothetical protein